MHIRVLIVCRSMLEFVRRMRYHSYGPILVMCEFKVSAFISQYISKTLTRNICGQRSTVFNNVQPSIRSYADCNDTRKSIPKTRPRTPFFGGNGGGGGGNGSCGLLSAGVAGAYCFGTDGFVAESLFGGGTLLVGASNGFAGPLFGGGSGGSLLIGVAGYSLADDAFACLLVGGGSGVLLVGGAGEGANSFGGCNGGGKGGWLLDATFGGGGDTDATGCGNNGTENGGGPKGAPGCGGGGAF